MNIFLHIHGRGEPKKHLVWMGRGPEDGMENFRILAARQDNDIDGNYHYAMLDITSGITPHLDLVAALEQGVEIRDESLYCSFFTHPIPTEPPFVVVSRAIDLQDAEQKAKLAMTGSSGAVPDYRATVNIGDGLAILKHKIQQYFGPQAA